jgi:hypothetical protein
MSFPNPDNYARDCDCGTAGANTTPPPATIQTEIDSLDTRVTALEETNDVIVSSGGIANLTTAQQALIREGSIVVTTDGRRWVYSGAGSKVLEASYIQLADITPVSPFVFENGGTITMTNFTGSAGYINTSAVQNRNGGSINTSNGGGSILTSGIADANFSSIGGSVDLRALLPETSNGGSIISTGNNGYNGGTLNMSAGGANNGGSIDTRGGGNGAGGSINTSNHGGSINTSGSVSAIGGSINTSGGGSINLSDAGGSINTSGDGGSINTRGVGSIQLGFPGTRTTIVGSASEAQTITLPNATGTIALTNDVKFGSQTIFTLAGEAKTVFALSTSYLYGCMPTRGPQLSGSYTSAVLQVLGNFTVTGISINQYLPSATTATLTYQLVRVTGASTVVALGSSVVVAGNNNLTTSASSISASLNSGDQIGLMLTLGSSGTVPSSAAATTILANLYCVPR